MDQWWICFFNDIQQSHQVVYLEICYFQPLIHSLLYKAQKGLQILTYSHGMMRLFWLSGFALSEKNALILFMLHKSQNSWKIGHESTELNKSISYYECISKQWMNFLTIFGFWTMWFKHEDMFFQNDAWNDFV